MKTWERFVDFAHFIGGNWVADSDVTTNRNPANRDDVIGTYAVSYTHLTLPTKVTV